MNIINNITTQFSNNFSFHVSTGPAHIIAAIFAILAIVGLYMVFKKAGEKGWKALIPIYSDYKTYDIFWTKKYFWIDLVSIITCIVAAVATFIMKVNISPAIFIPLFIMIIAAAVSVVLRVKLMHRIAKAFGHGAGFTTGLVFLDGIFLIILGFDKDTYCPAC